MIRALAPVAVTVMMIALNDVLDMKVLRNEYAQTWIELGSEQGRLYGIFVKAPLKGLIWYVPKAFPQGRVRRPEDLERVDGSDRAHRTSGNSQHSYCALESCSLRAARPDHAKGRLPWRLKGARSGNWNAAPHLLVQHGEKAIEFYRRAPAAVEPYRTEMLGGGGLHAQVTIGQTFVLIS